MAAAVAVPPAGSPDVRHHPAAEAPRRHRTAAVYWRRRFVAVALGLGLVVVVGQASAALGGSSLAPAERRPQVETVVVEPGDTLWSIAAAPRARRRTRATWSTRSCRRAAPPRCCRARRSPGSTTDRDRARRGHGDRGGRTDGYGGRVRCPYCRENDDKVVDSRVADDGGAIRRRRECLACGRRYTTYERVEEVALVVRKRDGTSEPFDRAQAAGRRRAGGHEPARPGTIDALVAEVEEELRDQGGEVGSERVGMAVLERLRALDHVAYLRFASVYKGFEDLADFEREVGELQKTTEPKRR